MDERPSVAGNGHHQMQPSSLLRQRQSGGNSDLNKRRIADRYRLPSGNIAARHRNLDDP
jgi:hypothetical protein